ncbi:SDR family NAD(P)-dependent oxidoreductase [Chitinophaga nivalis]|uniref:SDR family oxidoreductase n=1 Tax=Chitinophaga nivalis TaxID=2991709 RepID=A0ABT3IHC0_9BACT|nr:SDR family oxidoreductase [Chitinophaga nivalis]MCW3466944.1 SDR family oxidoreductase [Chitinophaga nivalis]MCW3483365.1 SDR family oxidoreductase [Chitinophaga nivalis]
MATQEFTQEQWDHFYNILQYLSKKPDASPDTQRLKGLVTKIYKTARKDIQRTASEQRKASDQAKLQQTVVFQMGLQPAVSNQPAPPTVYLPLQQELEKAAICYACRQPYHTVHFHYHRLCSTCAATHLQKLEQRVSLTGRTALITGARMKIGYATALRLLRDGARVIATTRFAADALLHYTAEPDYAVWKERLTIYELDMISIPQVEQFIQFMLTTFPTLDIIINNAAQTLSYPSEYYRPLIARQALLPALPAADRARIASPASHTAALPALSGHFPEGQLDYFHQPLDTRSSNSWVMKLHEVDTAEVLSANLVNNIAPFMLNSRLKPLLLQSSFAARFIINVTSSEGQFSYASKTVFHPHTNMTKAALNMMTRTSAADYAASGIYMNSVDVGWVSTGNPIEKKTRLEEKGFLPPLTLADAAARIYDPIIQGIQDQPTYGKLYKNYVEVDW